MAAPTIIQIKRNTTAGAVPASLAEGELAVNEVDHVLYCANSTAVFSLTVLAPGNTGANTDVVYNDSGFLNASAAFTFNKVGNIVSIANVLNIAVAANVGANMNISTSTILIGNSTANLSINSTAFDVTNSTSNVHFTPLTLFIGNSTANVTGNSVQFSITNSTANVRLTIPTATQISNQQYFLNANSTWQIPVFVRDTVTKTANYTIVAADLGTYFDNLGATGIVNLTTPTAPANGFWFAALVRASQNLVIVAANSTTVISLGEVNSAAGGNVFSSNTFSLIGLYCVNGTFWQAEKLIGQWGYN